MTTQKRILAVDDEPHMRRLLEISLRQADYVPVVAADGRDALDIIKSQAVDLVVSDLHMPGMNGLELLKHIRESNEHLPFIMVTAQGEIKTAVEAMKLGAADYILRPFDLETLEIAISKALSVERLSRENSYLKTAAQSEDNHLVGQSAAMQDLKKMIQQVGPEKATVLIMGETGTGKELIAQAIHQASPRRNELFVAVNCAAIPAEMMESELFGHEKGAFTGAQKERIGKFELADGGTLFLDEVTEMPIQLQAKLLRALQANVIERLGSNKQIPLDIRVIAATNREPLEAVRHGKLREDLYYRLNVFSIHAPPLRERLGDINLLTTHFLDRQHTKISPEALQMLNQYPWPGNVRELENILERAAILADRDTVLPQHIPLRPPSAGPMNTGSQADVSNSLSIPQAIAAIEKKLISEALASCKGNKAKAAKLLEISERSLWNKLDLYQLK
ncbi:MAG TPA: sigma-54 dependent transcriptional regulator [Methylophilus sp.]|nr:sigma-54 dependent transcriptional regulator [Methylophilus sp.]HQQ33003.1 sigma-54 dependent transcriptional regulator [Methylophilus sp.]